MEFLGISHAAVGCSNYEEAMKFYRDILGLKEKCTLYNGDDGSIMLTYLEIEPGSYIELFTAPKGKSYTYRNDQTFIYICLLVDDIEEAGRYFQSKGLKLYFGPKKGAGENVFPEPFVKTIMKAGEYCFYLDGPDGLPVEVMQYREPTTLMTMSDSQLGSLDNLLKSNLYSVLIDMPKEYRW